MGDGTSPQTNQPTTYWTSGTSRSGPLPVYHLLLQKHFFVSSRLPHTANCERLYDYRHCHFHVAFFLSCSLINVLINCDECETRRYSRCFCVQFASPNTLPCYDEWPQISYITVLSSFQLLASHAVSISHSSCFFFFFIDVLVQRAIATQLVIASWVATNVKETRVILFQFEIW